MGRKYLKFAQTLMSRRHKASHSRWNVWSQSWVPGPKTERNIKWNLSLKSKNLAGVIVEGATEASIYNDDDDDDDDDDG